MAPSPGYTRSLLAIELILETVLEREKVSFSELFDLSILSVDFRDKKRFFRVKLIS